MSNRNVPWFPFMLLFLIETLILSLFPELVGNDLKELIELNLGEHFLYWIILGGTALAGILFWLKNKIEQKKNEEDNNNRHDRDRETLILGTQKRYNKRIEQKLVGNLSFETPIKFELIKTETTEEIYRKFIVDPSEVEIDNYQTLFNLFSTRIKRLLILGDAGSGKTLLLLRFANHLLEKARNDKNHPIPIVVNLSSWPYNQKSFPIWLEKQLTHSAGEIGISKDFARELILTNQTLLLLDGLDEIDDFSQIKILDELSRYLALRQNRLGKNNLYPEVIICSRPSAALIGKIPIYGTVQIKGFKKKDVKKYLKELRSSSFNEAASRLLLDFKINSSLRQALDNSFFVHTALSVYSNKKLNKESILEAPNKKSAQERLLSTYIQEELRKLASKNYVPPKKSMGWLNWIARKIVNNSNNPSTFELADIHPNWLNNKKEKQSFFWFSALVSGIVVGSLIGTILGYIFGLFTGLSYGIILALVVRYIVKDYNFYEVISYDLSWQNFSRSFLAALLGGIFIATLFFLLFFFLGELASALRLASYFGLGITIAMFLVFFFDKKVEKFDKIINPYQRIFTNIFRHELSVYIFVIGYFLLIEFFNHKGGHSGIAIFMEYSTIWTKISLALIFGTLLGFFSNNAIHFSLLYLFFVWKRKIPIGLIGFLKDTAKHTGILEQDGGIWRFRHIKIQKTISQNNLTSE